MATRLKTSYSGDVGELEIFRQFLDMGASVNVLTGSDFGWDLHVQAPLERVRIDEIGPEGGWPMSGRVAHVQVKNMTSGQDPKVKGTTVRGWVTGSIIGTPTFVVVKFPDETVYVSPTGLQSLLSNWDQKNATRLSAGKKAYKKLTLARQHSHPFNQELFSWMLQLWTRHPGVLITKSFDVDSWPYMHAEDLKFCAYSTVGLVYLAWMKSHFPNTPVPSECEGDPLSHQLTRAAWEVVKELHPVKSDDPEERAHLESAAFMEFSTATMHSVTTAARQFGVWPVAELATSYAKATEPQAAMEEACLLIHDLMSYYVACSYLLPQT